MTPGTRIGPYNIVFQLASGEKGEVYLARDSQRHRQVALRVLPDSVSRLQDRLRRGEKEALAVSELNHPNIAVVYEYGQECGIHFIASEFIVGETLRERLRRASLNLSETLDFAIQIASALKAAHEIGVIHREVDPDRVVVGQDGSVKVMDFGLAMLGEEISPGKEAETVIRGSGTTGETSIYRAPEQLRGQEVDERTDIFNLGLMLYEMLARRHPFADLTGNQSIASILEKEPPPLEAIGRRLPARLERIVKHCLAKKADERYQSVHALLADLRKLKTRMEDAAQGERETRVRPPTASNLARLEAAPAPNDVSVTGVVTIAHVMFCDVVGFTILPIDRQKKLMRVLQRIVRETEDYRRADEQGELVRLPAGDGLALAFMQDVTAPVRCACDIARALREHPEIRLRIGIHSGPVFQSTDINSIRNVVGDGINLAHRVMDCGDGGHILVSRPVAEVLGHISRWAPFMHDLGEVGVKHGVKVHLFNLAGPDFGNGETPSKLKNSAPPARAAAIEPPPVQEVAAPAKRPLTRRLWLLGVLVIALLLLAAGWQWFIRAPERDLTYFLTIQPYRNGKPVGEEFPSAGREIFEEGWKFRVHLTSPQEGFIYLLNEEIDGSGGNFALLFPLPSWRQGSARLAAGERLQTDWYVFDQEPGRELLRLVWSARPVPELEALRELANPIDRGRISAPAQIEAVRAFLGRHPETPGENPRELPNRQTHVRGSGEVLVWPIELQHR